MKDISFLTRETVEALTKDKVTSPYMAYLVGLRGYDEAGENKRGIYDDAFALVTPDQFLVYNANTDPSITRKGIAVLQPGVYLYAKGLHGIHHLDLNSPGDQAILKQLQDTKKDVPPIAGRLLPYWALRQYSNVTVHRDGNAADVFETDSPANRFWIDIHKGGVNTTSSEGCQTIEPDQ